MIDGGFTIRSHRESTYQVHTYLGLSEDVQTKLLVFAARATAQSSPESVELEVLKFVLSPHFFRIK